MRTHAPASLKIVVAVVILHNLATLYRDGIDDFPEVEPEEPEDHDENDNQPDDRIRLIGQLNRDDVFRTFCIRLDLFP